MPRSTDNRPGPRTIGTRENALTSSKNVDISSQNNSRSLLCSGPRWICPSTCSRWPLVRLGTPCTKLGHCRHPHDSSSPYNRHRLEAISLQHHLFGRCRPATSHPEDIVYSIVVVAAAGPVTVENAPAWQEMQVVEPAGRKIWRISTPMRPDVRHCALLRTAVFPTRYVAKRGRAGNLAASD